MISYCIAVYRPIYATRLIDELCVKTSVPHEVLVWLNCESYDFERFVREGIKKGYPIRIVGRTPENIGMAAYFELFKQSQYEMFVQIDDDVVCVSPQIAEQAWNIFSQYRDVRQVVADVWQDEYTTGARPEMSHYRLVDSKLGLYDGPIDGWFSIYHRSVLNLLSGCTPGRYLPLGGIIRNLLCNRGLRGLLCNRMKVFHVIGPQYSSYFNMLDFEIDKYRGLGRNDIADWYEKERSNLPDTAELERRVQGIYANLENQCYRDETMKKG